MDKKNNEKIEIDNIEKYNWIKDAIDKASDSIKIFISTKYSHDKTSLWIYLIIVFILTSAITILSITTDIENAVIGTLLGSLIGFAFGNFPKSNKSDKSE
jgi:hypothetical protein